MMSQPPRPPSRAPRERPWRCPACGAELGRILLTRHEPPVLRPAAPCVSVRGGVLVFACPGCGQAVEWRIPPVRMAS